LTGGRNRGADRIVNILEVVWWRRAMTDRALLFLASLVGLVGATGVAVWLIATRQIGTFDGNFLLLSCLIVALAFALYLKYMIQAIRRVDAVRPAQAQKKAVEEPELVGKA
jgi:hypothetical protein